MKIAILGGPCVGKTTHKTPELVSLYSPTIILHTDDYISNPWPDIPNKIIQVLRDRDDWLMEGCQAARVLRTWLKEDPNFAPNKVYFLTKQYSPTKKQIEMAKGIETIFGSIRQQLIKNNAEIIIQ